MMTVERLRQEIRRENISFLLRMALALIVAFGAGFALVRWLW